MVPFARWFVAGDNQPPVPAFVVAVASGELEVGRRIRLLADRRPVLVPGQQMGGLQLSGQCATQARSNWATQSAVTLLRSRRHSIRDTCPSFDPTGSYLYFLSHRTFDPVYDSLFFDLGFPFGAEPYLVTLQAEAPVTIRGPSRARRASRTRATAGERTAPPTRPPVLADRTLGPGRPGRYRAACGGSPGPRGPLRSHLRPEEQTSSLCPGQCRVRWNATAWIGPPANGLLECYDLVEDQRWRPGSPT